MSLATSYTRRSKAGTRSMSRVTKERSTASPPSRATMPWTARCTAGGGVDPRTVPGTPASSLACVRRSSRSGSWTPTTPRSAHAMPHRPMAVSKSRTPWAAAQWSVAVTGESTVDMGTQRSVSASCEAGAAVAASDDADQGLSDHDHGGDHCREHHGDHRPSEGDRLPHHMSMLSPTPAGEGKTPGRRRNGQTDVVPDGDARPRLLIIDDGPDMVRLLEAL